MSLSFWKVAGGVVAGVGAVACLPVAGAVGAVTLKGAAIGGTIGGLGGFAMAKEDEKERSRSRYDVAEQTIKANKLKKN